MRRLFLQADFALIALPLLLAAFGALNIYSCTHQQLASAGRDPAARLQLQLLYIALGLVGMLVLMSIDYSKLASAGPALFGVCIGLLLVTLVMSHVRGSSRWIPIGPLNLQPGEFTQLAFIILLGRFMVHWDETSDRDDFTMVARSLVLLGVPAVLLILQPDLGTPIVLGFIWLAMLFIFGARLIHIGAIVFAALLVFAAAWNTPIIKEHQKGRIMAFVRPEEDRRGAGYHVAQSKMAIGSGHLVGQGPLNGRLSKLSFIPDQHTDFIFTVIGEEYGFLGSVAFVGIYMLMLWRMLVVAVVAKDLLGCVMAVGVLAMFFFHAIVNLGMTMGLMPVKGLPLPLISYGGSNMITSMLGLGMLQSIYIRRRRINF